jgi:hypothetical protein
MDKGNDKPSGERLTPFTQLYQQWDAPTYDPSKTYLTPKPMNQSSNRSVMSRLYERVLDDFSDARMKQIMQDAKNLETKPRPHLPSAWVHGSNG